TFGYTFIDFPNQFEDPTKVSRKAIGYNHPGLFKSGLDQIPSFTDWGSGIASIFAPGGFDPVLFATKHLTTFGDNVTKVYRTHTLKAGFFYENIINKQPNSGSSNGVLQVASWGSLNTGNDYADLLLGHLAGYSEQTKNLVNDAAYNVVEGFLQDSWKVKPNFTLELGLRLSHLGPWYGRNGAAYAIFDTSSYSNNPADLIKYTGVLSHNIDPNVPLSGASGQSVALGPRVGVAYSLFKNTVLRGGYGIFNYHDAQQSGALVYPPTTLTTNLGSILLSDVDNGEPERQKTGLTVLSRNDDKQPRTHSWNFTVSQRLPKQMVLETSYVGTHTQYLIGSRNLNSVPAGATLGKAGANFDDYRALVNYGNISFLDHFQYSNYNSLQMLLARQTGRLTYSVAYTFGKNLGFQNRNGQVGAGENVDEIRSRDYGVISYDRTHVLNIAYSWLMPNFFKGNVVGKALINGWQFSGITILESGVNIGTNSQNTNFNVSGTDANGVSIGQALITGTDAIQVQPLLLCDPREGLADGQYINGACFGAPSPGQNGVFQFPYVRGPRFMNHDLSIFKNFQIGNNENRKLQFRFSCYNFLNHPLDTFVNSDPRLQLSFDHGNLTNDLFGYTSGKYGKRIAQFAIKFMF
ncbi:MAG: carboxypeptidase regulatory-like domain-containing protein, partial [Acidobacteria bacterium]